MFRKKKINNQCENKPMFLRTANNNYEFDIIRSILEDNKIPYITQDVGCSGYLKISTGSFMGSTDFLVNKTDYDKAKYLVDSIFNNDENLETEQNLQIQYTEKLSEQQAKFINNEFSKYSTQNGLSCNYQHFNFIAKLENKIVGIISGHCLYDEVLIDELIVSENYRGKNVGTTLIKYVEEYYKDKEFNYISVFTHEFQAPKFYEKCGFKLEYTRGNKENPKLTRYFFIKYF